MATDSADPNSDSEGQDNSLSQDVRKRIAKYQKEIHNLKHKLKILESKSDASDHYSIQGLGLFILRTQNQKIEYVNQAFCNFVKSSKEELLGKKIDVLKRFTDNREVFETLFSLRKDGEYVKEVVESNNKHYRIKITKQNQGEDIVIEDTTDSFRFRDYVKKYIGVNFDSLSNEDLSTFKIPEKRFMTVSFTDLRGFTTMSSTMKPEDVRSTLNSIMEEIIRAVDDNEATVDKIVGDEVMVLYGAPKYYKDHALRAVKTACNMMDNLRSLREKFSRLGIKIPGCGISIHTGDMVVGNMGSQNHQDYTVMGASVNLASRICDAAPDMEIFITEDTLKTALDGLPKDWDVKKTQRKTKESTTSSHANVQGIHPLLKEDLGKNISIFHKKNRLHTYEFSYQYRIKVKGYEELITVISVKGPGQNEKELTLSDETIGSFQSEKVFGKYHLLNFIAQGGMGEVWKARDPFNNIVTIKYLIAGENATPIQIKRFKREAKILSKLFHRNICRIHEVGEVDHISYIAMEYIEGINLADLLAQTGLSTWVASTGQSKNIHSIPKQLSVPINKTTKLKTKYRILPLQQTISIIIKICEAIQFAHEKGMLHRDIKPSNILIRSDGEPVIIDFGLAKMEHESSDLSISMEGQILGTIEYMAPEQADPDKNIDELVDIYSIGAILYQMVTGSKHFKSSGNLISDAQKLSQHEPLRPSRNNSSIDQDLDVIIMKALQPNPKDRYTSVAALREDLELYRNGKPIHARPISPIEMGSKLILRHKAISSVIAISLFLFIFSTTWFMIELHQGKKQAEQALAKLLHEQQLREKEKKTAAPKFYDKALELIKLGNLTTALHNIETAISYDSKQVRFFELQALLLFTLEQYQKTSDVILQLMTQPDLASRKAMLNLKEASFIFKDKKVDEQLLEDVLKIFEDFEQYLMANLIQSKTQHRFQDRKKRLDKYIQRLHKTWPQLKGKDNQRLIQTSHGFLELNLNQMQIQDLQVLSGLPITRLNLSNTTITDISPLSGIPLESLNLNNTKVKNLKPLKGMKLKELYIANTVVDNLNSLSEMPLEILEAWNTKIRSLSPVSSSKLRYLDVSDTLINTLQPISKLPIQVLKAGNTPIKDIQIIQGMPLNTLDINNTGVKDIEVIETMTQLKKLSIFGSPIQKLESIRSLDLESLAFSPENLLPNWEYTIEAIPHLQTLATNWEELEQAQSPKGFWGKYSQKKYPRSQSTQLNLNLKEHNPNYLSDGKFTVDGDTITEIDFSNCAISNLESIRHLKLQKIKLTATQIQDLTPLSNMPLQNLDLSRTPVQDLSPLKDLPLISLNLDSTNINDLSPLKGMPLKFLNLAFSNVDNLDPLNQLKDLRELFINGTKVKEIQALNSLPLEKIILSPDALKGPWKKTLNGINTLKVLAATWDEYVNNQSKKEFFRMY